MLCLFLGSQGGNDGSGVNEVAIPLVLCSDSDLTSNNKEKEEIHSMSWRILIMWTSILLLIFILGVQMFSANWHFLVIVYPFLVSENDYADKDFNGTRTVSHAVGSDAAVTPRSESEEKQEFCGVYCKKFLPNPWKYHYFLFWIFKLFVQNFTCSFLLAFLFVSSWIVSNYHFQKFEKKKRRYSIRIL